MEGHTHPQTAVHTELLTKTVWSFLTGSGHFCRRQSWGHEHILFSPLSLSENVLVGCLLRLVVACFYFFIFIFS